MLKVNETKTEAEYATMSSTHCVGTFQGNELTRNSSGNARPQSSQPAEPLWADSGIKSGNGVGELISTTIKKI